MRAAIRRLIVRRHLSLSATEWEELYTLLYVCNPYAAETALTSLAAMTNEIECSYQVEAQNVKGMLHAAVSKAALPNIQRSFCGSKKLCGKNVRFLSTFRYKESCHDVPCRSGTTWLSLALAADFQVQSEDSP